MKKPGTPAVFWLCAFFVFSALGCNGELRPLVDDDPDDGACAGVLCSGHGTCKLSVVDTAICECEDGYHQENDIECIVDTEPIPEICSEDGWCVQPVEGVTQTLRALWGSSASNVWAVGDEGPIIHWNGNTWTVQNSGTGARLWDIWGAAANDVWAVGRWGTIIHYDGVSWTSARNDTNGTFRSIWGTTHNDVWSFPIFPANLDKGLPCTHSGFHWDGADWTEAWSIPSCVSILNAWGASADDAWAIGCNIAPDGFCTSGVLLRLTAEGWTTLPAPDSHSLLTGLWGTAGDDLWSVGCVADDKGYCLWGTVIHYNGSHWTRQLTDGVVPPLLGAWAAVDEGIWAVGVDQTIINRTGDSWWLFDSPVEKDADALVRPGLLDVWGIEDHVWAVGEKGIVLHSQR